MRCDFCNNLAWLIERKKINGEYVNICSECDKKIHNDEIEQNLSVVTNARDFKNWDSSDLTDAFWMHLGRYKNHPNKKSLKICLLF